MAGVAGGLAGGQALHGSNSSYARNTRGERYARADLPTSTAYWRTHAQSLQTSVLLYAQSPGGPILGRSFKAFAAADFRESITLAEKVLAIDPKCSVAWRLIGLACEGQGEDDLALEAFQSAYALAPDSADILSDLGRLSRTIGLDKVAAEFFARALARQPGSAPIAAQLSGALSAAHDYRSAIGVLRSAILGESDNALLWNALGAVLLQQGDTETALIMLDEALRLSPGWAEALFNRAVARLELGDLAGARADCDAASARAEDARKPGIHFVRAQAKLAAGDLAGGWVDYKARLHPSFAKSPIYAQTARVWRPGDKLNGKRFLLIGEQGLGDEIMFAGMIPDLLQALGADGRLILAVAPRLTSLFQRSFPCAQVCAHDTKIVNGRPVVSVPVAGGEADFWAPMGALARRFRSKAESFDLKAGYLRPAADATRYWRDLLADLDNRPKIGVAWKSMKTHGHRLKQYASFADWAPLLRTPGVRFVNLQYGDCEAELEQARALGCDIWRPPGLDLTQDIDGAAALSGALDLVIGVGNASNNLAAATGVETWFICPPTAWPRLGTDRHPWFHRTRAFSGERFGDWAAVMQSVAGECLEWSRLSPRAASPQ